MTDPKDDRKVLEELELFANTPNPETGRYPSDKECEAHELRLFTNNRGEFKSEKDPRDLSQCSDVHTMRAPDPLPEQLMYKPFFDLVANKNNWKSPIDAMVDAPQDPTDRHLFKLMISRAVMFYAGCAPLIVDLGDKQIAVKAVGYYKAVGA